MDHSELKLQNRAVYRETYILIFIFIILQWKIKVYDCMLEEKISFAMKT